MCIPNMLAYMQYSVIKYNKFNNMYRIKDKSSVISLIIVKCYNIK